MWFTRGGWVRGLIMIRARTTPSETASSGTSLDPCFLPRVLRILYVSTRTRQRFTPALQGNLATARILLPVRFKPCQLPVDGKDVNRRSIFTPTGRTFASSFAVRSTMSFRGQYPVPSFVNRPSHPRMDLCSDFLRNILHRALERQSTHLIT